MKFTKILTHFTQFTKYCFKNFTDGSGFVRVMYIFFLGVVPFIALSLLLFYYWRQNRPWFITQANEYVKNEQLPCVEKSKNIEISNTKLIFSTNSEVWHDWH